MLRHFLNATARTSSSWLFVKPNAPAYVSSTRSLFTKPNSPFSGSLNFFSSTARTSFRSLLAKPNALVYVSSLRLRSGQKASRPIHQQRMGGILILIVLIFVMCAVCSQASSGSTTMQLTSIVPLASKEPDLREWTRANMEYKLIDKHGFGMPSGSYFFSKTIVAPETMPELMEIFDDLKSCGLRVEESENYLFLEGGIGIVSRKTVQLTSIVPLGAKEPDLREWTRASLEFKMIDKHGSGMPYGTYFWSKTIVAPETMPKLKEILDELKSDGARVEESENYYFLEVGSSKSRRERFLELLMWLEEPSHKYFREEDRRVERRDCEEYAWSSGPRKPSSLPKPRRMDQSCYEGV